MAHENLMVCDLTTTDSNNCISCGYCFNKDNLQREHRCRVISIVPSLKQKVITIIEEITKTSYTGYEAKFVCRPCHLVVTKYANCVAKLQKIRNEFDNMSKNGLQKVTKKRQRDDSATTPVVPRLSASPLSTHPQLKANTPLNKRFRKTLFSPSAAASPPKSGSVKVSIKYHSKHMRTSVRNQNMKTLVRAIVHKDFRTAANAVFRIKDMLPSLFRQFNNTLGKEAATYCQGYNLLDSTINDQLEKFSWRAILREAREQCPLLMSALEKLTKKNPASCHIPLAAIFSMIMGSRVPKMNFVKKINGLVLYQGHVRKQVYTLFNRAGWCISHSGVLKAVRSITADFDKEVITWKTGNKNSKEDTSSQPTIDRTEYSLVFDNLNFRQVARHHISQKDYSHQYNLIHTMAIKHRITFNEEHTDKQGDVAELPLTAFLMNQDESNNLRSTLKVLIQRILTKYIPFLEDFKVHVPDHIHHYYQEQSNKKSTMIPLGLMAKDETKTKEMVAALDILKKYVPDEGDSKILLWGDGLSVERANDAQRARLSSSSKLDEFIPVNADWHAQVILLQDAFNLHYKTSSSAEKGTLYQLRNRFNWRGVKKDISSNVNSSREFLEFVTSGFVVLAALEILGLANLNSVPEGIWSPSSVDSDKYIDRLAFAVLDRFVFQNQQEKYDNLRSQVQAPNTAEDASQVEESLQPATSGIACGFDGCNKVFIVDGMVRRRHRNICAFKDRGTSYQDHSYGKPPNVSSEDSVLHYSCSILRHGLLDIARHDAVRENDGDRIVLLWKHDFLQYYHLKHSKYAMFAFDLQCQLQAILSLQKAQELKHNRTVNFFGLPGRNVPVDLALEFKNRELKEHLKRIGPNIEKNNMQAMFRAGEALKPLGQITQAYQKACNSYNGAPDKTQQDFTPDITCMVEELQEERLFTCHPGRQHPSFTNFPADMFHSLDGKKLHDWMLKRRRYMADKQNLQNELKTIGAL